MPLASRAKARRLGVMEVGTSHPIGERRVIQPDALPGVDLCLAIQRQVAGEHGDKNLGDGRLSRQFAFDQPRGPEHDAGIQFNEM